MPHEVQLAPLIHSLRLPRRLAFQATRRALLLRGLWRRINDVAGWGLRCCVVVRRGRERGSLGRLFFLLIVIVVRFGWRGNRRLRWGTGARIIVRALTHVRNDGARRAPLNGDTNVGSVTLRDAVLAAS